MVRSIGNRMGVKSKPITKKKTLHIIIIFSMLSMILSRLTWLQLRETSGTLSITAQFSLNSLTALPISEECLSKFPSMPVEVQPVVLNWFKSLGFLSAALMTCYSTQSFPDLFTKYQILCLFWIVVLNVLMTRMLTGSWLLALLVGTVLFSRGAFLARIDRISEELIVSFFISLWLVCTVRFIQTRAKFGLIASLGVVFILSIVHGYAFLLALAFLIGLATHKYMPSKSSEVADFWSGILGYRSGFHLEGAGVQNIALEQPTMWRSSSAPLTKLDIKAALRTIFISLMALGFLSASLLLFKGISFDLFNDLLKGITIQKVNLLWSTKWQGQFAPHLDKHFILSLLILFAVMVDLGNSGFTHFKSSARILFIAFSMLLLAYLIESALSYELLAQLAPNYASLWLREQYASENPLIWFESNILTFGIIGFVHLLIRIQSRLQNYKMK